MPRILVVDDEQDILDILSRFLTIKNYDVLTSETCEEALATLAQEKVDLVLLDINMPGMSGLEALRSICAAEPGLPVVMVSGQGDEEVARSTLKEGAFDYVTKPVNLDYLERTLYMTLFDKIL